MLSSVIFLPSLGASDVFHVPSFGTLNELAHFGLLTTDRLGTTDQQRSEITLLQELRNALQNDFDFSDYFLTTSAVGTIVYGDLTLDKDALFQSAAAGVGDVNLSTEAIPDKLIKILGDETLRQHVEIATAIEGLRNADQPTRLEKIGKVIQELGRDLGHLSNTAGAIAAITLLARVLSSLGH